MSRNGQAKQCCQVKHRYKCLNIYQLPLPAVVVQWQMGGKAECRCCLCKQLKAQVSQYREIRKLWSWRVDVKIHLAKVIFFQFFTITLMLEKVQNFRLDFGILIKNSIKFYLMWHHFDVLYKSWQISAVPKTAASLFPFGCVTFLIYTELKYWTLYN